MNEEEIVIVSLLFSPVFSPDQSFLGKWLTLCVSPAFFNLTLRLKLRQSGLYFLMLLEVNTNTKRFASDSNVQSMET